MNVSMKRMNAIFMKDLKDFSRNMSVSAVILMPLLLTAVYGQMGAVSLDAHYLIFNMTFALVTTYVQCCLIAEEKEKNTLRGLMLSPASTLEILGGKSLLSLLTTLLILFLSALLSGYQPANAPVVAAALVLSAIFYIGLGTLLGLWARSVMDASVIVLPVLLIFSMGAFAVQLAEDYPVLKAAEYLPSVQLVDLAAEVEAGAGFGEVLTQFGIIGAWTAAAVIITVILYRKRMVD